MKKLHTKEAGLRITGLIKGLGALTWLMTKGMMGIFIISLAIAATIASYLICFPFLLCGQLRQLLQEKDR